MGTFRASVRELRDASVFAAPPHMFEKLAHGVEGWSGPIATIAPQTAVDTFRAMREGDVDAGRAMFRE